MHFRRVFGQVEGAEGQAVGAPANPGVRPGRAKVEDGERERGHGDRLRGRVILRRGAVVVKGTSEATARYFCMDCGDPCDEKRKAEGDEDKDD
jgi:hypothetical protein